jgi:hypothetical protein
VNIEVSVCHDLPLSSINSPASRGFRPLLGKIAEFNPNVDGASKVPSFTLQEAYSSGRAVCRRQRYQRSKSLIWFGKGNLKGARPSMIWSRSPFWRANSPAAGATSQLFRCNKVNKVALDMPKVSSWSALSALSAPSAWAVGSSSPCKVRPTRSREPPTVREGRFW